MIQVEHRVTEVVVYELKGDQKVQVATLPVAWLPEILQEVVKGAPRNTQWRLKLAVQNA